MTRPLDIVVLGLSLSSSWGNGHATTYRSLLRGLKAQGHDLLFLERDVPWYADHRDLPEPDFCRLEYYRSVEDLKAYLPRLQRADAVIVGSYVPDGVEVIDLVHDACPGAFCFYDIDTPVTLAKLDAGEEECLARRQVPLFDIYLSFSGGGVLDRLEQSWGAREALPLFCSVDASRYFHTGEAPGWDLSYLGTYSPDRQPMLEQLLIEPARRLPHMRFVVAGSQYPSDIEWPSNVERIEHLPPTEHASFYTRSRFTLNVTRADMVASGFSPSVRLFEAAACGTPIVSDRWEGLTELLPENEAILIAESPDEVVRPLTTMPEAAHGGIAAAARERVLAYHTGEARARELAGHIERFSSNARTRGQASAIEQAYAS